MKILKAICLLLLSANSVKADESQFKELSQQPNRPTVTESFNALDGQWPTINPLPFQPVDGMNRENGNTRSVRFEDSEAGYLDFFFERFPRAIARLEYLFPGATWALLGRDSTLLADALEAYYLSLGQSDRVVQIGLSSGSLSASQDVITQYLESLGAPTKPQIKKTPWVVLDRTSYGGIPGRTSGTNVVIEAIYDSYIKNGGEQNGFAQVANVVSLNPGNGDWQNGPNLIKFSDTTREEYFASEPVGVAKKVIAIYAAITDGVEWHGTFLEPQIINGQVNASPGPLFSEENRLRVLWEHVTLGQLMSSKKMHEAIDKEFIKLGLKPLRKKVNCDKYLI